MVSEIKAHVGSVHKLSWAHPEFGQVLASCSSDRVVHIYEEQTDTKTNKRAWKKVGKLTGARDSVQDLQFAPRHVGLKLATCCLDGQVRIYESSDVMNLSSWPLSEEFAAAKRNCYCLTWNPSAFDPPMLAVGSQDNVKIWECHPKLQRWQSVADLEVSGGPGGHEDEVHDIAWAPNMGRTYHLIATACKDQFVRIWKLKYTKAKKYEVELVARLGNHKSEVWRVSWNVTGTILASTGDDGTARLWKCDHGGQWQAILLASPKQSSSSSSSSASAANSAVSTETQYDPDENKSY